MQPKLHAFLDLEDTDRTHWLSALFDAPGTPPPYGIRYPVLRAGESPYTWLCDQFQKANHVTGARDRIRRSVVEILVTEANREPVTDRAQVLGQLLEVAGTCGFTTITETLRGWLRADSYAGDSYRLGRQTVPMRRTVWSVLIAWRKTKGLKKLLQRDFSRPELGSQQLCFAELGRQSPDEAILRIPETLDWPEPYWREALYDFFTALGAREVVSPDHLKSWTNCLGDILFHQYKADLLTGNPAPLREVMLEAGISWDPRFGQFSAEADQRDDPRETYPSEDGLFGSLSSASEQQGDPAPISREPAEIFLAPSGLSGSPAPANDQLGDSALMSEEPAEILPPQSRPFGSLAPVGTLGEGVEINRDRVHRRWDLQITDFANQALDYGKAAFPPG